MKLRIHLFEWPSRHNVHFGSAAHARAVVRSACGEHFLFHTTFPRSNGSDERIASVTYILPGSPEASKLAPNLQRRIRHYLIRGCRSERLESAQDILRGEL